MHTKTPFSYYSSRIEALRETEKKIASRLSRYSFSRLIVFVVTAFAGYYFYNGFLSLVLTLVPGISIFLWLVSRYNDLRYHHKKTKKLIAINENELQILDGRYEHQPTGAHFTHDLHFYSKDIDLFGKGSFFQYLNRTELPAGSKKLAELLTENATEQITEKQESVKELAQLPEWRQEYQAVASLINVETTSEEVIEWINRYKPFTRKYYHKIALVFTVVSLLMLLFYFLGYLPGNSVFFWFLAGLGISGFHLKKSNLLSENVSKIRGVFDQYAKLVNLVETFRFQSDELKEKAAFITGKDENASAILRKFSKLLDSFDQRNNMIFGVLANGFFLWDLYYTHRIEYWISHYQKDLTHWFETIAVFDAWNSLGNFAFNHPGYVYPEIIKEGKTIIHAEACSHPLLDPAMSVSNTIYIENQGFHIITGANMAGKSTFLRTVALHIVMANSGLPVCASSSLYRPVQLITSMRTSDSLSDNESYFFSELKRLKQVVEAVQKGPCFVILDEILKGTNSTDKAIGSRKFIEKLVSLGATGIVATHDLSLCVLEDKLPQIKNYYFDAEIVDGELFFDYRLKKGICKNMNASFLLKKMEIV
ncbi:MutS-related protein [Ascidiimonas aurantiaca]|uniref:MutS-related protein n=1 Tax=Ascidiimonas aurantiaca TaxID=1685432 RepID=UPI0030EC825C